MTNRFARRYKTLALRVSGIALLAGIPMLAGCWPFGGGGDDDDDNGTLPVTPTPQVVFWTRTDSLVPASVYISGERVRITDTHSAEPSCGASGAATFTLSQGSHGYEALLADGLSVEGSIDVGATGCVKREIVYSTPTSSNGYNLQIQNVSSRTPNNVSILFRLTTSTGDPVLNFPRDSVRLFEDLASVSTFESRQRFQPKPGRFLAHAVLLLDLSGSILGNNSLSAVKLGAENFVTSLVAPKDSAGAGEVEVDILYFDGADRLHPLISRSRNRDSLVSTIRAVSSGLSQDNSTNLYGAVIDGLQLARARLASDSQNNIFSVASVVVFTDGTDQAARRTLQEAQTAVQEAKPTVSTYTIGLGGEINPQILSAFGYSGFFLAGDLSQLVGAFQSTATSIRARANSYYLLEYCSPKRSGMHTLKIQARLGSSIGSATTEFNASSFTGGCSL